MELTGLLQMAPFRGMKEEELVAFLFGLPNSLKHFEPGDLIIKIFGIIFMNLLKIILILYQKNLFFLLKK